MADETEVSMRDEKIRPDSVGLTEKREARAFRWKFCLIYLAGVFAATSMGKMTPISVELRDDLSLSLAQVALLTSLVTTVAAAFGLFVSYLIRPLPPHRMLVSGLVVMGLAGLYCARTDSFRTMLIGRLAESMGYVVVVIAAPVLLFTLGDGKRLTGALAIWGTFMPVGLALGSFAGGVLATWLDWREWLTTAAGATLVVALGATRLPAVAAQRKEAKPARADRATTLRRLARPVSLGAGFATISGSIVACVTLYPTYLHEEFGLSTEAAGTLTGVVSLVGVAGGFLASWLLVRGVGVKYLFLVALLMPAAAFAAFAGAGGLGMSVSSAVVIAFANELVVATVFAAVPVAVRAASDLGAANGLVAQFGSLGALATPPLVGLAVTEADSWWAVGPCLLAVCVAGLVLLQIAVQRAPRAGTSMTGGSTA
jgi:predicted MFS family arabinose efflux permease